MKFEEFEYKRPVIEDIKIKFESLLNDFQMSTSYEKQDLIMTQINRISNDFSTQSNLAYIRASINTNDLFYQDERAYIDEIQPMYQALETDYYQALVTSPFRPQLEDKWGIQLFLIAENAVKSFSPEIIPLLQEENKLSSEYSKLIASAQIPFDGKTLTLAQLAPYTESTNRAIRKVAVEASAAFYSNHEEILDTIYDQLVKIRHEIATTLGYENFVELAYIRMNRIDFNAEMVKNFRNQVREQILPIANRLYEQQACRIGVEKLKFYDEAHKFPTGNPVPHGSAQWIIEQGQKMYEQLSPETNDFFHFMMDKNLMDLTAKTGKESGGYCTFIDNYQAPFIFSNFNGTAGDIDVLTHEAGHAFQVYSSRHIGIPEYSFPTYEAAEIHSMSMEFFTWPWMELFFNEEADRYKFSHLSSALLFLPYGVAVDEFQHIVYENPTMTPTERKSAWKKVEETYLPTRDYDGIHYLESGNFWKQQSHIYEDPFYYIDYALAQICAFQFWDRSLKDFQQAWQDYLHLCKLGGSKSFTELIQAADLRSPFEEGCIESTIRPITDWLAVAGD